MIKLTNIDKTYLSKFGGECKALKNINLEFKKGEFVGIVGKRGSGKTTLLNILAGIDKLNDGNMYINNTNFREFTDKDIDRYRKSNVGIVYQKFNLLNHLTVLENVELALKIKGETKTREKAKEMLIKVGLPNQIFKKPTDLLDGQKKRVALARALVTNPDILLLDEPTQQLDSYTSTGIMELIKRLSKNKLVIMVTQKEELVKRYASRIIKLTDGRIIDDTKIYNSYVEKEEEVEEKKTDNKKINLLSISYTNIKGRKITSFLLLLILTITFSLILTSLVLRRNDIYQEFAPKDQLNLIKLKKDNEESFSSEELNNLAEIDNIQSIIPIYFNSAIINYKEPSKQISDLKIDYKDSTEIEQNSKIFNDLNTIKNVEILPKDNNKFYLNNALVKGVYPKAKNEVIIDINAAIELIYYHRYYQLHTDLYNLGNDGILSLVWPLVKEKKIYLYNLDTDLNLYDVLELEIVGMVDNSSWIYSNVDFYINSDIVPELLTMYNINDDIKEVNVYINNFSEQSRGKTLSNINNLEKYINISDEDEIKGLYNEFKACIDWVSYYLYIAIMITILSLTGLINSRRIDRINEIGILKSLGVDLKSIKKIFLNEIMIIFIISFIICYPIAYVFSNSFLENNKRFYSSFYCSGTSLLDDIIEKNYGSIYPDMLSYILVIIIGIILMVICAYFSIYKNSKLYTEDSIRKID